MRNSLKMYWITISSLVLTLNYDFVTSDSPILLVPGFISSQLEAKVDGHGFVCDTFRTYHHYWFNILKTPKCVSSALSLEYNSETNEYSNAHGVSVRVPGFGETETVEFLDQFEAVPMFHNLVEFFVARGYVRGHTIRAAPYDWRLAADHLEKLNYYVDFKNLVEEMYAINNEKVTIVGHSMGGIVALYFFNNVVSGNWKDTYINAFVPVAGAWSGGNMALPIVLSGLHKLLPDIPIVTDYLEDLAPAFQSFQSTIWLLPHPSVASDTILVTSDMREYSANDYEDLFNDAGYPEYYTKHDNVLKINGDYAAPNVPTYCLYGTDVPTPESFHYGSGFPNDIDNIVMGNGDGQVNLISAEVCLRWSDQDAFFTSQEFPEVEHISMLSNTDVLNEIAKAAGVGAANM